MYSLGTWICLRNICVNTLHNGDSIFTNNNNNNNTVRLQNPSPIITLQIFQERSKIMRKLLE
jgi:hypothetical protein